MKMGTNIRKDKQLPISEYQQRFFLEWALAPQDTTYNVALVYKITGNLDKSKLIQACDIFTQKHEICHARYNEDGSKCYYKNYKIEDFLYEGELDPDKDINLQLRELLDKPFDLTHDALLKFILMRNSKFINEYYLIGPFAHHIIADAYSGANFARDISQSYNLLINKHKALSGITKTFTQAVYAEQMILTRQYKQKANDYWLTLIADFPLNIQLPYKSRLHLQHLNNKSACKKGDFVYFNLNDVVSKKLEEYARKNKSTLFIVLSAIYGLILSKYSNQSRLLIAYPVNMRPRGYRDVPGCFVNNVLSKFDLDQYQTLDELVSGLTLQRKKTREYQA
jgi:hypothetical protein